jgi:hypothetical protein
MRRNTRSGIAGFDPLERIVNHSHVPAIVRSRPARHPISKRKRDRALRKGVPYPKIFSAPAGNPSELQALKQILPGGSSDMPSSAELRRQAAHCLRIAAAVDDQTVAATLVAAADDFSAEADEIDPSLRSNDTVSAGGSNAAGASR